MAPFPREIDVYSEPHLRMKWLVHSYSYKMKNTNFSSENDMERLLNDLYNTLLVFRCHEQIENEFILSKLKMKLQTLSISPENAVCNCHSDNRLSEVLAFVENGKQKNIETVNERIQYGQKLREILKDFTEHFLPHMDEEEEVFQPLLMKYFSYEELKSIKAAVLLQHTLQLREKCGCFEKFFQETIPSSNKEDIDGNEHLENWADEHLPVEEDRECSPPPRYDWAELPDTALRRVMSELASIRDVCRVASVCSAWRQTALTYPVVWARLSLDRLLIHGSVRRTGEIYDKFGEQGVLIQPAACVADDDADWDEAEPDTSASVTVDEMLSSSSSEASSDNEVVGSEEARSLHRLRRDVSALKSFTKHLLPVVGHYVLMVDFSKSRVVTNTSVSRVVAHCPSLCQLDVSHTQVDDAAFKRWPLASSRLTHLDLSGCDRITDLCLTRLAAHLSRRNTAPKPRREKVSGTDHWTTHGPCHACDHVDPDVLSELCDSCPYRAVCMGQGARGHVDIRDMEQGGGGGSTITTEPTSGHSGDTAVTTRPNTMLSDVVEGGNTLVYLSLSGCHRITDEGIGHLARARLTHLAHLDLSGVWQVSGRGLCALVRGLPRLSPQHLYYCDNVQDGPWPRLSNGCANLQLGWRFRVAHDPLPDDGGDGVWPRACCRKGE